MSSHNFDKLPLELFDHIMFLIGRSSLESLDTCRKVCNSWNKMIMRSLWEEPNKQWGPIIRRRLEENWDVNLPSEEEISKALELEADGILCPTVIKNLARRVGYNLLHPNLQLIRCAACLAHKGPLRSVYLNDLNLLNVDLASVPAHNLASLIACVMGAIHISNVSGCDLVSILQSIRSKVLDICCQRLDSEETGALVQSMESSVEVVWLGDCDDAGNVVTYSQNRPNTEYIRFLRNV